MTGWTDHLTTVVQRELCTLYRTRSIWILALLFFGFVVGTAVFSGTSGYVPLALSLLTPLEILIPVLVATLGYRAILADRERNELLMLQTYPLSSESFVLGVYCGRLVAVLLIVCTSLLAAGVVVPVLGPTPAVLEQHSGLDSPILYARFIVLTAVFAAVVLAILVLISALARTARRGLIAAVVVLLAIAIGVDLAIIFGLAGGLIASQSLPWYLAMSPASAYRGLVLTYVVAPVTNPTVDPVAPIASLLSLSVWWLFSLGIAGLRVWDSSTALQNQE